MYERNAIAALAILTAWLSIAALARSGRPTAAALPPSMPHRPDAPLHAAAVRALRDGERIDLNQAALGDLELLPGIGPALAQRIIDERTRHGAYERVEALTRVRGIGARTIERIRGSIRIEPASAASSPPAPRSAVEEPASIERGREQEPRVRAPAQQE